MNGKPRDYESEEEVTKPDGTKIEREVEDEDSRLKAARIALIMGMICSVVCAGVAGYVLLKAPHVERPAVYGLVAGATFTFLFGCITAIVIGESDGE